MGWSDFKTSGGRGTLHFCLVIEGLGRIWTTADELAQTLSDGRIITKGLYIDGPFSLEERVQLKDATLEVAPATFRIEERYDQEATAVFARQANVLGYLSSNMDESTTTLPISDSSGLAVDDVVHVGTEAMKVDSISGGTVTVERAVWDTIAQKHYSLDSDVGVGYTPVLDRPATIRNRRVLLYVYEGTDLDVAGAAGGTLIWRGIVTRPASLNDGVTWTVQVDNITSILDREIARKADSALRLRGAYYSWAAPIVIRLTEHTGTGLTSSVANTTETFVTGHYETDEEVCNAVTDAIATAVAADFSSSPSIIAIPDPLRGWYLQYQPDIADPRYCQVHVYSCVDGSTFSSGALWADVDASRVVLGVSSPATYFAPLRDGITGMRDGMVQIIGMPRNWFGSNPRGDVDSTASTSAPMGRVYYDGLVDPAVGDAVTVDNSDDALWTDEVSNVNTTDRWYDPVITGPPRPGDGETEIRITRSYVSDGNLNDFRDQIVARSVEANKGQDPHVTSNELSDWAAAVASAVEGKRYGQHRQYAFGKAKKLGEVLSEDAKLIGGYFRLNGDGKIDFQPLRLRPATAGADVTLTSSNIISVQQGSPVWPRWAAELDGVVNTVEVHHGYDPKEDEHAEFPFEVTDATLVSYFKKRARHEIKPFSKTVAPELGWEEVVDIANVPLHYFGANYQVVELMVDYTVFDAALCGATVSITDTRIPNVFAGTRGVTGALGLIIGRRWDFPGYGTLTILLQGQHIGGYAPSARVTNASPTQGAGDIWTMTVTTSAFADGVEDQTFFDVGDIVEVVEWDGFNPQRQTGKVMAIFDSPSRIMVSFDGTAPWGASYSGTWICRFRENANDYTQTTNQKKFVYVADGTMRLVDDTTAWEFSA